MTNIGNNNEFMKIENLKLYWKNLKPSMVEMGVYMYIYIYIFIY